MSWIYLTIAGIMEIVWAVGLKYSNGFTNLWPSVVTVVSIILSFLLFSKSLKTIPIGTGYAVFTGIGAAGTAAVGMIFLDESVSMMKIFFITLMIISIIGLKYVSGEKTEEKNC
jgi:quaternary ammonium compound-resistance protein SugE